MAFIQIIEASSTRLDEIQALTDEWLAKTEGKRTAVRAVLAADRDRPNTYVQIVEFPSYEAAMANSDLPETSELADKLAKLCDSPPTFRNLDVQRVEELASS
jgi:quinol monooxygenase YgiN